MASFNLAILGRFARVNEIVDDIVFLTKNIQGMQSRIKRVRAFQVAGVSVGEIAAVVRLNGSYSKRSNFD